MTSFFVQSHGPPVTEWVVITAVGTGGAHNAQLTLPGVVARTAHALLSRDNMTCHVLGSEKYIVGG